MQARINIVMLSRACSPERTRLFEQTVKSMYAHTGRPEDPIDIFTLTVVDDGSEPPAHLPHFPDSNVNGRVVPGRTFDNVQGVRLETSPHILGDLKRLGVKRSEERFGRAPLLCICDNDCYFQEGWLERIERLIEVSEPFGYRLWGGQNHPFHNQLSAKREIDGCGFFDAYTLAGTHMVMRWDTWDTFAGELVSEGPGILRGEDVRFCSAITKGGYHIGVTEPPCVVDCGMICTDGRESPGMAHKPRPEGIFVG